MPNDLETGLVAGGITPAAAKIIANAIANLATSQVALGRQYGDATPTRQLRMIDGDTRRYVFTNLDQPADAEFAKALTQRGDLYSPRAAKHTYRDSQPATAKPTLTAASVAEGDYIASRPTTKDEVSQSQVGLDISDRGGQHARLNPATGQVEAVPFLIENDQEQFIEAKFEERPEGTVLKLRLRNLDQMWTVTTSHPNLVTGQVTPTDTGVNLHLNFVGIRGFNDFTNQAFWAWDR